MILTADYPFLDVVGTMLVFFFWVMWFWCLIVVLSDVFRRRDIGGWAKAAWTVAMILVPLAGVLVYLIAHGRGMAERRVEDVTNQRRMLDDHIRTVAGGNGAPSGPTAEIAHAKALYDSGTISADEFEQLKRKVLTAV